MKTANGLNIHEKGVDTAGNPMESNRRLFMQFLAFGSCDDIDSIIQELRHSSIQGVLYKDLNDPQGIGLLAADEDPGFFAASLRDFLNKSTFNGLSLKHEFTMLGRTYSIGYETDLEHVLLKRPLQRVCNPDCPWAVWYPLRRSVAFAQLPEQEQRELLMEHGQIGHAFGDADYAHDIRLACFGLDKNDNDFVIGLLGKNLHPLSAVVQTMRKTRQTSEFIERLGPFFIGRVAWQSRLQA